MLCPVCGCETKFYNPHFSNKHQEFILDKLRNFEIDFLDRPKYLILPKMTPDYSGSTIFGLQIIHSSNIRYWEEIQVY